MDLKRYDKVEGDQALAKLLAGERIYNRAGTCWIRKGESIFVEHDDGESESTIPVLWFVNNTTNWYVKKPFDVRAEMLTRPNEWVGAFKRDDGKWVAIGFDLDEFEVSTIAVSGTSIATPKESALCQMLESSRYLDLCIPIEDVPEEELT